jgi:small subunit ribosomal protein S8e
LCFAGTARKTRIIDTVYNASNNELVRTKTLVKGAIVTIDAIPFRQWYEAHYALPLARKKGAKLVRYTTIVLNTSLNAIFFQTEEEEERLSKKRSKKTQKKYNDRQKLAEVEPHLIEEFQSGRLLGKAFSYSSMFMGWS